MENKILEELNVRVSNDFYQMLTEFIAAYLIEQPPDPTIFAADYFNKLLSVYYNSTRFNTCNIIENGFNVIENESKLVANMQNIRTRRQSIVGETYNPEEDNEEPPAFHPKTEQEMETLKNACQHIFLFRSLDTNQMQGVIDSAYLREVKKDETIIIEGGDSDFFFVVQEGVFDVFERKNGVLEKVKSLNNAESYGELALLYNQPRTATVKAATDGKLWLMSRKNFRRIVLKEAVKKRKMYANIISKVTMLEALTETERLCLADALITKEYKPGDYIIRQSDEADGVHFLESGKVRVTRLNEDDEEEIEIKQLGPGDYFGELALITHRTQITSFSAITQVVTAFLEADGFERLLGPCRDVMLRNIKTYGEHVKKLFNQDPPDTTVTH